MILYKSSVLNKKITLLCPSRPSHVIVIKGFYLLSVCLKKNILKNGILRKNVGTFFENLYKKSENLYKKLKSLAGSDVKYRDRICGMSFGLRITFRFQ